jgi:hypothetical protein
MHDAGKYLIVFGIVAILIGVIIQMGWGTQAFGWIFRLPGDIRIERDNFRFYIPITTCIVISIILTVIIRVIMMLRNN